MAHSSAPICQTRRARNEVNREENDQDYDSSASAASVAVNLLSTARLMHKLDSVFTEYSAKYIMDYACPNKENGQGETDLKLTVKDCLEFAFKEGIPKADSWPYLGCLFKPPSAYKPPLVSMKGDVIVTENIEEAFMLLKRQPVGAKLHVFSPAIDLVGDGVYFGLSRDSQFDYVGLRDVIIVGVTKVGGETVAEVKICYKKKVAYINVALDYMFMSIPMDGSAEVNEAASKPGRLLVDFCVPRLSIE